MMTTLTGRMMNTKIERDRGTAHGNALVTIAPLRTASPYRSDICQPSKLNALMCAHTQATVCAIKGNFLFLWALYSTTAELLQGSFVSSGLSSTAACFKGQFLFSLGHQNLFPRLIPPCCESVSYLVWMSIAGVSSFEYNIARTSTDFLIGKYIESMICRLFKNTGSRLFSR